MLQAVVGENHVAVGIAREQLESGGDAVARHDDHAAGAREQQRLVADFARIVSCRDRDRRVAGNVPAVAAAHHAG